MKINSKVVNIPPFISTSWENIASLHMKGSTLAFVLSNGDTIYVPGLAPSTVELIFAAHVAYLEEKAKNQDNPHRIGGSLIMQALTSGEEGEGEPSSLQFGFPGMSSALKHDPSQKDTPPLPDEILGKIAAIAKIVSNGEEVNFPKSEPGCNCVHCQICRAISGDAVSIEITSSEEPLVLEEDLRFAEWEIVQLGDKLYEVTNPLDKQEKYSVFLGEPVGCTCGKQGCEHVIAVLRT